MGGPWFRWGLVVVGVGGGCLGGGVSDGEGRVGGLGEGVWNGGDGMKLGFVSIEI